MIQSWYSSDLKMLIHRSSKFDAFLNTVHPTRLSEPDSNGVLNAEDLLSDHTEHLAGLISMD